MFLTSSFHSFLCFEIFFKNVGLFLLLSISARRRCVVSNEEVANDLNSNMTAARSLKLHNSIHDVALVDVFILPL